MGVKKRKEDRIARDSILLPHPPTQIHRVIPNEVRDLRGVGTCLITVISDVLFRPLRVLIVFVEVQHRALPDVKISKAYGLSSVALCDSLCSSV